MFCLFPTDMMSYGLGEEILIEVAGLETRWINEEVLQELAAVLGLEVYRIFSKAYVQCLIHTFNRAQGFWCRSSPT